jgi:5-methylthioadenosine/S-adenosylhomocysteine deaminase
MIASGVTTFADMYYFEENVAEATALAGMRAVAGQTVLKFPTPDAASYEEGLERAREFISTWRDHELIMPSIAAHAPYTCTEEIVRACTNLALEFDVPLQIHIAEMALEQENSQAEHGMTSVPWLDQFGLFEAKVLAAHCVHIDEADMRLMKRKGAGAAHCPTSNLKLASGIAKVTQMLQLGMNVGVGTDGPASNNDLDMLEETRLAAILAKTASNDPRSVPAREAVAMATRLGARAIHMDHLIGTLEVGKRADLTVVDISPAHNRPQFERDPDAVYSQLVYAAKSTDVLHVMCNGAWLLRDQAHQTLDPASLVDATGDVARRIDTFLIEREGSVYAKLAAVGEIEWGESFEVQVKVILDDPARVQRILDHADVSIVQTSHYRQYDTYFMFDAEEGTRLRYREDDFIDPTGEVGTVRTRLTLTGPSKEREFDEAVLLSRSRFIADAGRPLRFYREYFQPTAELEIEKERKRWHVDYKGLRFYVNLDEVSKPTLPGYYLEIKSTTWSQADAEQKATIILEMLDLLEVESLQAVAEEYVEMAV